VTGPGDDAGLSTYVVPKFESQGKATLQHDVGPGSVIPGELVTLAGRNPGGRRESTQVIRSHPGSNERLQVS